MLGADLLAAASLALAALAVMFGLWSPEISRATATVKAAHLADRITAISSMQAVFSWKALPLTIANMAVALTLLPPFVEVIASSVARVCAEGLESVQGYRADQALFIVVVLMLLGLVFVSIRESFSLHRRLKEFQEEAGDTKL